MSGAAKGKIAVGVLVLVALWALALVALGGGPPERAEGAKGAGGSARGSSAPAGAPSSVSPTTAPSESPEGRPATPTERSARNPDSGATNAAPDHSEPDRIAARGGTAAPSAPPGASGGADAEVDGGRAKQAATQFVVYAYGYSGENRVQYESYVNQAVVPSTFEASPGAAYVEDFAARVASRGTNSTVTPRAADVLKISPERAVVRVSFTLRDPSGTHPLAQRLAVVSLGPVWKVAEAEELERT